MTFTALGLSPALAHAVQAQGFDTPTAVQAQVIPKAVQGADVLACAPTGSGKTWAYALPCLEHVMSHQRSRGQFIQALVVVPTRELASQVGQSMQSLVRTLGQPLKVCTVHGGASVNPQMMALRGGADVLVATPGRLLDLVDRNAIRLDHVRFLVLDEADRLLELGFSEEWARIQGMLPAEQQRLLFSATFDPAVLDIAQRLLHQPEQIGMDAAQASPQRPQIEQRVIATDAHRRTQLLRHLIGQGAWQQVLVFVATKYATEIVADKLRKAGIAAEPFHGMLSQGKRTQVLHDFKTERIRVVVATDLAARGLDIQALPVVVNYDLPRSPDDYTHRIGRTARAGRSGTAISFITPQTKAHFALIARRHGLPWTQEVIAGYEPSTPAQAAPFLHDPLTSGGIKGKRPNKKDKARALAAQGLPKG